MKKGGRWLKFLFPSKCWIFQPIFQPLTVIQRRSVVRPADTGNTKNASGRDTQISLASGLLFVRINDHFSFNFNFNSFNSYHCRSGSFSDFSMGFTGVYPGKSRCSDWSDFHCPKCGEKS